MKYIPKLTAYPSDAPQTPAVEEPEIRAAILNALVELRSILVGWYQTFPDTEKNIDACVEADRFFDFVVSYGPMCAIRGNMPILAIYPIVTSFISYWRREQHMQSDVRACTTGLKCLNDQLYAILGEHWMTFNIQLHTAGRRP